MLQEDRGVPTADDRYDAFIDQDIEILKSDQRDSYLKSGQGLWGSGILAKAGMAMGGWGKGERLVNDLRQVRREMRDNATDIELINRINNRFLEAGVDVQVSESLAKKVKKYKGGKMKYAEGGSLLADDMVMEEEAVSEETPTHQMPDGTVMPGATHEEYEASMSDMESDDVMEDNYMDFILDEALEESEEQYLMEQLEANPELSMIFDKVFDVASEFAGSGPVDGPGSGVSDSIPARLSDGEFVFTTKAVEEIGADNLQQMMEDAEASADQRQPVAYGGYMNGNEDDEYNRRQPLTEEEQLLDMQRANPRRFYRPISG
jgi:hypothetical protein